MIAASSSKQRTILLLILAGLALTALFSGPMLGERFISPRMLRDGQFALERDIFWQLRVPRVLVAFLAGGGLAVSGMAFQGMFRNPLATPFTLGVSSGASLGTALFIRFGSILGALGWAGRSVAGSGHWSALDFTLSMLGVSAGSMAAFAGALGTLFLVYGITRWRGGFSSATLLLAGVAVSFFFSSLILFIQYLFEAQHSFAMMRWMMGSLETDGYRPVLNLLVFVGAGAVIILTLSHELNLLLTGDDLAISRGVAVRRVKRLIFFAASLMVGGIVSLCGPIGFVGMMVPHICRLTIGSDHRWLTPAVILGGGTFLIVCDLISRTILTTAVLPVGIITALLGGPFFLWLLMQNRGFTR